MAKSGTVTSGRIIHVEEMPTAVRTQYDGLLQDRDRLWAGGQNDAASAKWDEADALAEPYTRKPEEKADRPPPTAADPPPPEFIPDTSEAIAICTSPDVCRSPTQGVPYMAWGKADDDQNYSPDVRSNGLRIKRANSAFTTTRNDEPGTGLGIVSNTVGDIIEPTSWSSIVFANGIPVERHGDTCTLNNDNCPGEYVHVKSTQTDKAPDGRDEQDKTRQQQIDDYANSKGYRRAPDGGWYTDPNNTVGWVSDSKLAEEMDYVASGAGTPRPFTLGSGPSELKPYEPSWAERISGGVQDGLMSMGMDKYPALTWEQKVSDIAGFLPVTGSGISGNESARAFERGDYVQSGIHAIGALPLPGAAKRAEKVGSKVVERVAAEGVERAAAREADEAAAAAARQADEAKQAERATESGKDGVRSTLVGRVLSKDEFMQKYGDKFKSPEEADEAWTVYNQT